MSNITAGFTSDISSSIPIGTLPIGVMPIQIMTSTSVIGKLNHAVCFNEWCQNNTTKLIYCRSTIW